jgi:hypothetical protein
MGIVCGLVVVANSFLKSTNDGDGGFDVAANIGLDWPTVCLHAR